MIVYAGDGGLFKSCTKCGELLHISSFTRSRGAPLDRRTYCRACGEVLREKWAADNPDYAKEWYAKNKDRADETSIAWQKANPDKVKASWKKYYEKNKDALSQKNKARRQRDPEKTREANIRSMAKKDPEKRRQLWADWYGKFGKERNAKMRQDPKRRVDDAISGGIWRALKGKKGGKSWRTMVDYTLDDLMDHLEKQFAPGMTWENYGRGGWEVDHIIPRSVFNYTDSAHLDFKRCWALDNLQPMWTVDNQSKGSRLEKPFQPSLAL